MAPSLRRSVPGVSAWARSIAKRAIAAFALAVAAAACSVTADESSQYLQDRSAAAPAYGDDDVAEIACAPEIAGLTLAGIDPIEIECPKGYDLRAGRRSMPTAGRFTSQDELTKAFCVERTGPALPDVPTLTREPLVDFSRNDVVVYAYDARVREPVLHRRVDELWLRIEVDACNGVARELASVAFVVPKHETVHEQTCSRACR
jgi:hypothetical protein